MSPRGRLLQPILRQWLLLLAVLASGVGAAAWNGWFWRADLLLYDAGLAGGPAPADIVIVAIDDASLAQIGRWPWRRAIHAALLERLRAAAVRAVALDLVFSEPDAIAPGDDATLAAAMSAGLPTVLPLIVEWPLSGRGLREVLPVAPLAAAAARLGHAHLELDRDGIARSVYLREGLGQSDRPHLALALLEALGDPGPLPGERRPAGAVPADAWARDYHVLIPFLGPAGHFQHYSYVDVLNGAVPDAALRGKLVLVGATAQGLSDAYPTPRSGEGIAMPGVEISANVLAALESKHAVHPLPRGWSVLLSLLPLVAGFVGFLRFSPRGGLVWIVGLGVATLAASLLALRLLFYWWPPAAAFAALVLAYPLWSWRRLEATQGYLDEELARLNREPLLLEPAPSPAAAGLRLSDVLQARIDRVRDATARLRHLRRLLGETIASLPDALLLVDRDGRIVLGNPRAAQLFGVPDAGALEGRSAEQHLAPLLAGLDPGYQDLTRAAPSSIELRHAGGRDLMLRVAPFLDERGERAGYVIDIADVTELKRVERERDDTIRFLSHDLRSPSSSLLGLAQLLRDPDRAPPPAEAARRIESLASRTLALADGFIALARAQFIEPRRFEVLDLRDALQDAIDEVWASAQARQVAIMAEAGAAIASVRGDRQMLGRALANLLGNAVKYSPPASSVLATIEALEGRWRVRVRDRGPGIALDRQGELFQRFRRAVHHGDSDPGGVGLGLAFVRVVADKHGGAVTVESEAGGGATFSLELGVADAQSE